MSFPTEVATATAQNMEVVRWISFRSVSGVEIRVHFAYRDNMVNTFRRIDRTLFTWRWRKNRSVQKAI